MRIVKGLLVLLMLACAWAPAAAARSVLDPDIGWPAALRRELGLRHVAAEPCRARLTREQTRLQDRIADRDPREALYLIFHDRPAENLWGDLWFDPCDGGRLQAGVASGGSAADTRRAVRQARTHLSARGLSDLVRLVAVRSTYRQLSDQVDAFGTDFADLLDAGLITYGIDTSRNTVDVEVARRTTPEQEDRLLAAAAASPVNVVLHPEPTPAPTYTANIVLDRDAVRRSSRRLALTIYDGSCSADETHDSPQRFAGVGIVKGRYGWVLTARFRTPERSLAVSTCEGNSPDLDVVRTTVSLPEPVGRRAVVDGARGPGNFRFVVLPPVGQEAIRSLVPRFIYTGDDCESPAVRAAFRGRAKGEWCFF